MTLRTFVGFPGLDLSVYCVRQLNFFYGHTLMENRTMSHQAKSSIDKDILIELSRRTALPWLRDAVLDWAVILGAILVVHIFSNPGTWLAGAAGHRKPPARPGHTGPRRHAFHALS